MINTEDPEAFEDKRKQVQLIQQAIDFKKSEKPPADNKD